jgi:hypothetical protein
MSFGVIDTCTSFSASTKVSGVTVGPTGAAVPNAGGAPGVLGVCLRSAFIVELIVEVIAAPISPIELFAKNSLRDFAMMPSLIRNSDISPTHRAKSSSMNGPPAN